MEKKCKHCNTELSPTNTFCRSCGTLTGVEGDEPTVIVRMPQPDGESPWAKMGTRYQQPSHVHRVSSNRQTPSSVIDIVLEQESVHNGTYADTGMTRIISKPIGAFSLKGWLVALSGFRYGESWVVCSGKNLIGRNPGLTVTLTEDAVSGIHATLWIDKEDRVTLVDRDSANGTFVNGEQIFSPVQLTDGDVIRVGEKTNLQWVQFHAVILT